MVRKLDTGFGNERRCLQSREEGKRGAMIAVPRRQKEKNPQGATRKDVRRRWIRMKCNVWKRYKEIHRFVNKYCVNN